MKSNKPFYPQRFGLVLIILFGKQTKNFTIKFSKKKRKEIILQKQKQCNKKVVTATFSKKKKKNRKICEVWDTNKSQIVG